MDFKTKRRCSFFVIVVFMFLDGIEYGENSPNYNLHSTFNKIPLKLNWYSAVVFPTLWEYLLHLGTPEADVYYLGLCIGGTH